VTAQFRPGTPWIGGALVLLAACEPGKTHILGRVPERDAEVAEPDADALEPDADSEPGEVPVSGAYEDAARRGPELDAGAPEAPRDVGVSEVQEAAIAPEAAALDDAALTGCRDSDDCATRERPFCSEELGRCVECTRDRHCYDDEYCRDSTGVCVEQR
jgi:hypothetical protein